MKSLLFTLLLLCIGTFLAAQEFVQIESRWKKDGKTTYTVHVQEPTPAAGHTEPGWWSKDWIVEDAGGGFVRFKNRWRANTYLLQNVDNGPTEAGAAEPGYWSAQWKIEPAGGDFVRLKNRWKGTYLHIHNATLDCGPMLPGQWGAQWILRGYKGNQPQPGPQPQPKPQPKPQPDLGPAHDVSQLTFGATPTPPAIQAYVKKVAPATSNTAPKAGVFSLDMPPIGNQGTEGSCVAWALGYGIMSYEMKKRSGLGYYYLGTKDLNPMQIASPEYLFNRSNVNNGDCSNGSYFVGTPSRRGSLDLLRYEGVAPLVMAPYSDKNGCGTVDNYKEPVNPLAAQNRIDQYALVEDLSERNIKTLLNKGYPILVGANLTDAFMQGRRGYIWSGGAGKTNGQHANHAMVIMGYDDSKRAFKLQNSWGTNWGDDGYGWISYDLVSNEKTIFEAYVVYADKLDGYEITEPNYVTVYSEALYVATVKLTYTLNGTPKEYKENISAFFSFEHQLPKQAKNVRLQVDGIAVLDGLDFDKTYNSNSIQACYKIWGSIFDTEYASMTCSY